MRSCVVVSTKKSSFLGSPRDVFRRPSAAPELIAPKFLHTTFPSKYFVLAEFHPPRLSFGGVMPPTPSGASLHYGLPYSIQQAIIMGARERQSCPFFGSDARFTGLVWNRVTTKWPAVYSFQCCCGRCKGCAPHWTQFGADPCWQAI